MVFIHYYVPHCTKANLTDKPRAALAYHFVMRNQIEKDELKFDLQRKNNVDFSTPVVTGPEVDLKVLRENKEILGTWSDTGI